MIHTQPALPHSPSRVNPRPLQAQQPPGPEPQNLPQDQVEPGLLRKAAGSVVAAGCGSAGLIYGGAQGLYRGATQIPAATVRGGQIGTAVVEPITRTAGAVGAVALTGVAGLATVGTALVLPLASFVAGTVEGALTKGGPVVSAGARTGAQAGAQVGSAILGAVGGSLGALVGLCSLPTILYPPFGLKVIPQTLRTCASAGFSAGSKTGQVAGRAVGGGLGGLAGGAVALTQATPDGWKAGVQGTRMAADAVVQLPETARGIWKSGQSAGKVAAQATGGTVGVVAGVATGLVGTAAQGVRGSVEGALDWGQQGYQAVAGKPDKSP